MTRRHEASYSAGNGDDTSRLTCTCKRLTLLGPKTQLDQAWSMHLAAEQTPSAAATPAFTDHHALILAAVFPLIADIHLDRNPVEVEPLTSGDRNVFRLAVATLAVGGLTSDAIKAGVAAQARGSVSAVYRAVKAMPTLLGGNEEARIRFRLAVDRITQAIECLRPVLQRSGLDFTIQIPADWKVALDQGVAGA